MAQAQPQAVGDLSVLGNLSSEQQTRIDNAGDDIDRLQQTLLDLHQKQYEGWAFQSRVAALQGNNESRVQAEFQAESFKAARQRIHDWKPVTFEDYVAGKVTQP